MSRPGEMSADAIRRACGYTEAEARAVVDRCTKTTVAHQRWSRFWGGFAVTTLAVGIAGDTAAYVGWGYPATLTCTIRRAAGIHPRTRYARAGQVVIGSALGWALVHLVTGAWGPSRGRELV